MADANKYTVLKGIEAVLAGIAGSGTRTNPDGTSTASVLFLRTGVGYPVIQSVPNEVRPAAFVIRSSSRKCAQVGMRNSDGSVDDASRKEYENSIGVLILCPESLDPETLSKQLCDAEAAVENALDQTKVGTDANNQGFVDYQGEDVSFPLNALPNASSVCNLLITRFNPIGGA
jgi:hypothetical protein